MAYFSNYCEFSFSHYIVTTYVLNQLHGHWLLTDALHFAISLSLKLKEDNELMPFESLMEDEFGVYDELILLTFNIKNEAWGVLNYLLSFIRKY